MFIDWNASQQYHGPGGAVTLHVPYGPNGITLLVARIPVGTVPGEPGTGFHVLGRLR